ncbi:MAG: prepilin-type N-terminal cleavage/methylation domain-containing protein [Burkholderiales bacterium]|jgi:type IV pilus assembly protein PilV|nr:prepilin-type N-terminal cleavage/methylation domain-containing protein [Burkholderiales bacterium]
MVSQKRKKILPSPKRARGFMLIEVLVSILIFALGILALVGLQARSMSSMSDVQYRAEAMHLANAYVGKMWAAGVSGDNPSSITPFSSDGTEFIRFKNEVDNALPGASGTNEPTVTVTLGSDDPSLSPRSVSVGITIFWQAPNNNDVRHQYFQQSGIGVDP